MNNRFSVIDITEDSSVESSEIDGFTFVNKNRQERAGGGVGLYISNDLSTKLRHDLVISDVDVDALFIEINVPQEKNVIVGVIYRAPNQSLPNFLTNYQKLIAKISRENKICYIMGDFNLNLLNHQSHGSTGEFLDIMYSFIIYPLITKPSRITSSSATLIDNIFTNHFANDIKSGLLFTDISDNLPVFTIS